MKINPESKFNHDKCLPPHMTAPNVEDILYRIGLCMTSVVERPIRLALDHPFCAFIIVSIFLVQRVITCSLSDDNHQVFIALGSHGYLLGIRQHMDMFFILVNYIILNTLILRKIKQL